jgi:HSP20 family protein
MALVRWTPLLPSFGDSDKFFDDFNLMSQVSGFVPALDVYQTKDDVVVETALPGVDPKGVNISIENDVLTMEGSYEKKSEVDERNYYRQEIRAGSFHRSVALPAAVNGDKAKATYEKGMLKIVVPKEERAKPKTVKVDVK